MINSKKIVLGLLLSSFSFQAFPMEQEAVTPAVEVTQEEIVTEPAPTMAKAYAVRTIDFVTNKLGHIKKCLQGKEVCSKTDFALLFASFLFLKGLVKGYVQMLEVLAQHAGILKTGTRPISRQIERVDPEIYGWKLGGGGIARRRAIGRR